MNKAQRARAERLAVEYYRQKKPWPHGEEKEKHEHKRRRN